MQVFTVSDKNTDIPTGQKTAELVKPTIRRWEDRVHQSQNFEILDAELVSGK